ncbi:MAG TPA: DUF4242 domain-containing protein [Chitinophagaceae bacterium]|nr:DUF4242 domain-containing protein [Chitinophagaceae bacterium]
MKPILLLLCIVVFYSCQQNKAAVQLPEQKPAPRPVAYYMDIHNLEPGKVSLADVAAAHEKDLATQGKYGVSFLKYWVDEQKGKVYCLSKSPDEASVVSTHKEAHGLIPAVVYKVTDGPEAVTTGTGSMYIDVHEMKPGSFTAKDVADAHEKDLNVEAKYKVNFVNYWADEKAGVIMCLSEAPDSASVISTHKEAHGLLPAYVLQVKQGH